MFDKLSLLKELLTVIWAVCPVFKFGKLEKILCLIFKFIIRFEYF